MKAIIYINGRRRWSTDDGAWVLGIQKGEALLFPDEYCAAPGMAPANRTATLERRRVNLVTGVIELHVEPVEDD